MSVAQLVLGTARFGLDGYGFLAGVPRIAPAECERIVRAAWDYGVRWIETAEAYGDAEQRLGEIGVGKFRVVTKLAPNLLAEAPAQGGSAAWLAVQESVYEHYLASARRLKVAVDGYLLHSARYALRPDLVQAFLFCCDALHVPLAGVACYAPEEAFAALAYGCTAISVPHNLFDLRAWDAGVFVEAERRGAAVFARQPFCQGLLAMEVWPPAMPVADAVRFGPRLRRVHEDPARRRALAMGFAVATAPRVVLGCDSVEQLREDAQMAREPVLPELGADYGGVGDPVCNPSRFVQP